MKGDYRIRMRTEQIRNNQVHPHAHYLSEQHTFSGFFFLGEGGRGAFGAKIDTLPATIVQYGEFLGGGRQGRGGQGGSGQRRGPGLRDWG